jgi:hypothetical protein
MSEVKAMMRLARRAVLFVALYMFASAATAYAECAWVLWEIAQSGTSIIDAVGTRAECEDRLEAHMKQVNAKRTVDDGSRATAYARIDGVTDRIKYQCLPDTVDPRGPKGK